MNDAVTVRSRASMERDDRLFMGGLLLILFATRIACILSNPDATQYWEEDYRWIAPREILAVEDRPDQPFGQQMLHQHLIDRRHA